MTQESPIEQFKKLVNADSPEAKARYKAIRDQRDVVLSQVVLSAAKFFLAESKFNFDPQLTPNQNNQEAIKVLEEYLADSSLSELEQYLLALAGTGALHGWAIRQTLDEDAPPIYEFTRVEGKEIDPLIIHRLAKALDRSKNIVGKFQSFITSELVRLSPHDAELVKVAIQTLLSETPLSQLDEVSGKIVLDSMLGG